MAGQNSLIFGKDMAAAGQDSGRQQDSFPTNRFSLELVDVLLAEKCVFRLNRPTVTVGIFGENTWNLPLESLFGPELFESLRTHWEDYECIGGPLLKLKFNPGTSTWRAVVSHPPDPNNRDGTWKRKIILKPGMRVDIGLGTDEEEDCYDAENLGFFSLIFHDANQPEPRSSFIQKLASLPPVVLGMIASHLKPHECIHNFCVLSPSIPQKLRAVGVQWSELTFSKIDEESETQSSRADVRLRDLLDCLRALKLVAASGNTFKSFYLGDGQDNEHIGAWQMPDYVKEEIFRAVKKLIFAPKLQDLWLAASWLPFMDPTVPLPGSLQTVYVRHYSCNGRVSCFDFWTQQLPRLKLPTAAKVSVHVGHGIHVYFDDEDRRLSYPTDGFSLPNVTSVSLGGCMHSPFLPPKALPNLQKLELLSLWHHGDKQRFGFDYWQVNNTLDGASSFPKLKTAKLQLVNLQESVLPRMVNVLATAAPNLDVLELQLPLRDGTADDGCKRAGGEHQLLDSLMQHLPAAVGPLRRFVQLQRLKMSFTRPASADELESLLNFCLALLGTKISIIELDCVDCSDAWSRRVQSVSEFLKQSGKDVLLTRRAPELVKLPCSTQRQQKGLSDYKVIVHDQGLKLGDEVLLRGHGEDELKSDDDD